MPLLPRQKWEVVVAAFVSGATMRAAYEAGGFKYEPKTVARFFQRPVIQARVAEVRAERAEVERDARKRAVEKTELNTEWIINNAMYAVRASLRGTPTFDRNGVPTGHHRPDYRAAVSGLTLLADIKGMRIQRTEIGGPGAFNSLSDAELEVQIIESARAAGLPEQAVKLLEDFSQRKVEEE